MYIFRGRGVFIDVYKADNKLATSGATSLDDIDLQRTYRARDSVATGSIPSLFCATSDFKSIQRKQLLSQGRFDWPILCMVLLGVCIIKRDVAYK